MILALTAVGIIAAVAIRASAASALGRQEAEKYTAPAFTVATKPVVSIVGDSYTGGSDQNSGTSTLWWSIEAIKLGFTADVQAVGGSGYYAKSPTSTDQSTFVDRSSKIDPTSSVVIFFGSRNDYGRTAQQMRASAAAAFANARKVAPKARFIVIGPPWVDSSPPANVLADRDGIHAAASAIGAVWVDPIADDWFPDGNKLIGTDGIHPTDAGHAHIAKLVDPVLAKYVPSTK